MDYLYPTLIFDPGTAIFVREIKEGIPNKPIPPGWETIIVYHPSTNQYFTSKTKDPYAYELLLRNKEDPKRKKLALVLLKLFAHNEQYQFFVLPLTARAVVERWLGSQGKRRVVTKMGEAAKEVHVMFQVESPFYNIVRYVVAPASESAESIIDKANESMTKWLRSSSTHLRHERNILRIATGSRNVTNEKVFDKQNCIVKPTDLLNGYTHNQFRSRTRELNEKAARKFVFNTTF